MKKKKNKASRKRSAIFLSILLIIIMVAGVFTFVSFDYSEDGIWHYNGVINSIKLGIDLKGGVYVVMQPKVTDDNKDTIAKDMKDNVDGILKILQNRLTSKGYTEATVVQQTDLTSGLIKIRIEIPDVENPEDVFKIIGSQAKLEFFGPEDSAYFEKPILTGKDITKAYATYDNDSAGYAIAVKLTPGGQKRFAEATAALVGKKITIKLDGAVLSDPSVSKEINSENFIITGMKDLADAEDKAMLLMSGSLPIEFESIEPRSISATLGADAMEKGLLAGIIGIALVMLFMGIYYRGFGLIADIALMVYVIVLLFLMSQLPWVQLTLPGIAGIILSIGMAVDANVIIFERIKDEYRTGKTIPGSVQAGFKRAFASIFDSNVTTAIAAVVLWLLGTGTIQGFAITLFLGIIVSMFTALLVTRFLIKLFMPINNTSEKFYGLKRGDLEDMGEASTTESKEGGHENA